jgi:uncharacterized membrane protein
MNRFLSLVLLIVGVVLVVYGINAADSLSSSFSRLFTGAPTDKTVWLLVGGALLVMVGAGSYWNSSNAA